MSRPLDVSERPRLKGTKAASSGDVPPSTADSYTSAGGSCPLVRYLGDANASIGKERRQNKSTIGSALSGAVPLVCAALAGAAAFLVIPASWAAVTRAVSVAAASLVGLVAAFSAAVEMIRWADRRDARALGLSLPPEVRGEHISTSPSPNNRRLQKYSRA